MEEIKYIDIDKDSIPYKQDIKINDKTYSFTILYNRIGDFFTLNLERNGKILIIGEKINYGIPMFNASRYKDIPDDLIIPFDLSGEVQSVKFDDLGDKVRLYLLGDEDG